MKRERVAFLNAKLIAAIRREDVEGVRNWLNEGASPNGRHRSIFARFFRGDELSPLVEAIRSRSPEIVRILLEAGADPQEKGVLGSACWSGPVGIVELLISFGAHAGPGELVIAVQQNQLFVAELLLERGIDSRRAIHHLQWSWFRTPPKMLELFEEYGFDYTDEMKAAMANFGISTEEPGSDSA